MKPERSPSQPSPLPDISSVRTSRLVAIVTGLLGFVLALATPLLPVKQDAASITWPQNGALGSVEAPLVSYTPQRMQVNIPCAAVGQLGQDGGTLLSTLPGSAPDFEKSGLVVSAGRDGTLDVRTRGISLISATAADVQGCDALTITSDYQSTSAEITGTAESITGAVPGLSLIHI